MTLAVGVAVGGLAAALTRTALDLGWALAGAAGLAFGAAAGASLQALWEDRHARARLGSEPPAGGAVARRRAALAALVSTVVTGAALVGVGSLAELPANLRAGLQVLVLATGWAAAILGWLAARPPAGGGERRAGGDPGRPPAEGRRP